ncbi:MAG: class I SAM-dependent methyltransferase [Terrimicrobiaceae bacterium]
MIEAERFVLNGCMPPWTVAEHKARYDFVADRVGGLKVLDCACGSGVGSLVFANRGGAAAVLGVDSSPDTIRLAQLHPCERVSFVTGNACEIPCSDGWADIVVSLETIEHVERDLAALTEYDRCLSRNGIIIISTPNRIITNPKTSITDKPWNRFHIREYSDEEFVSRVSYRFEILEIWGQNPVSAWMADLSSAIAKAFGSKAAVRFNQLSKCRWFLFPSNRTHRVQKGHPPLMEYTILVARKL